MFSMTKSVRHGVAVIATGLSLAISLPTAVPAVAQDAATAAAEATYKEIEAMLGGVPTFAKMYPKAGIAGAWALTRDLEFSETTLDAKTKALIGIAVAAQIPCEFCIWSDTNAAKAAGATDEEIAEAVGMAALTRHWSTIFHGLQLDFATFKQELGGE
jgi:AhpD family alkylhydroperoxidase